ncbi:hypothetical protein PG993_013682 [Apiospora rasikravindrae]|uniref:Integral membrane protein n=1 Tax=Apiospora rasikravindrae TaxID=990691 RepID=A0ABR1RQV7_9PEZI
MRELQDPNTMVVAASWTFATLAAISLGLRIWCRMFRVGMLWWDDLVLGIAVVILKTLSSASHKHAFHSLGFVILLQAACISAMFHAGLTDQPIPYGRPVVLYLVSSVCAAVAAGLSKTAYMITLLRLTTEVWTRRLLYFFIASLNVVLWFSALACWAKLCEEGPSQFLGAAQTGGPYLPGRCWPGRYVTGAVTTSMGEDIPVYAGLMDLTLALFPWGILRNLHIHKRHKIGISTSMSVSAFAVGPLVMTMQSILAKMPEKNLSHTLAIRSILFIGGPAVTVIAQAVPVLRAFFTKYDLKRT